MVALPVKHLCHKPPPLQCLPRRLRCHEETCHGPKMVNSLLTIFTVYKLCHLSQNQSTFCVSRRRMNNECAWGCYQEHEVPWRDLTCGGPSTQQEPAMKYLEGTWHVVALEGTWHVVALEGTWHVGARAHSRSQLCMWAAMHMDLLRAWKRHEVWPGHGW